MFAAMQSEHIEKNRTELILNQLGTIICGGASLDRSTEDCEISIILKHLKNVILNTTNEIKWLFTQDDEKISFYGPFLSRSLIEVSVTALIGRIDPTRLLVVKRIQEKADYDISKPWNSAIRWLGDVMDKDPKTELWESKILYKDISKSLLGEYYTNLYWEKAFKKIIDSDIPGGTWLAEIKTKDFRRFQNNQRNELGKIYSESSKGIHSEFVIAPGSRYDKSTVENLLMRTIKQISELGLLINFISHIPHNITESEAIANFSEIESSEFFNEQL